MKKYYTISNLIQYSYKYGAISGGIAEYYLLNEGYIDCFNYRKDFNDDHYMLSSCEKGNRADYCSNRRKFEAIYEVFDNKVDAKRAAILQLYTFYKEESLRLVTAYRQALVDLEKQV